ncbi:HK97 gp10 family phage protein [Streptomyces griseoaurantiacus]|uniref:HK97 gp10 family phage protein n=1 Tax=Streptomyces griseoaurantiacus TaxID=68213 RepID=A0A7W2DSJ5_9ACTN|nr:HK97 gp10 family phage protein [Streptomyces griseoaurantiacus]MBA5222224.1 HK97 gp10 family phage protein [Streptomyces griseoaurantiacus]
MRIRFAIDPSWQQHLEPAEDQALEKLGGDILSDMKRTVPVRTGRLKASLDAETHNGVLRVGSRDVDYSVDVELGTSEQPAEPYMRPALYRQRSL